MMAVFLGIVAVLLVAAVVGAWWVATYDARWRGRYEAALAERELLLEGMTADSSGLYREGCDESAVPRIVVGESALSARYFGDLLPDRKRPTAEVRYTQLSQLARREAVIKMLEAARSGGYNAVCNVKIETADIGHTINAHQRAMVLITAVGTAYRVN